MLVRYPTVIETTLHAVDFAPEFAGTASQPAKAVPMPIVSDLLNLAALILAGIAGALVVAPVKNAKRLVPERLRVPRRRD